MSVPMPLIRIAMLGLKPIRIGASTVAPNMAITCWMPIAPVCSQGSRSSGAMTAPLASVDTGFSVQLNMCFLLLGWCVFGGSTRSLGRDCGRSTPC
ncbi:hypothetical protein FQZ97_604980 [compost metagenome]